MNTMTTLLLRLPESMNDEVTTICDELHCTKSQFIRQSITRNLDVVRNVEVPLLRRYHTETTLRALNVTNSVSQERKDNS